MALTSLRIPLMIHSLSLIVLMISPICFHCVTGVAIVWRHDIRIGQHYCQRHKVKTLSTFIVVLGCNYRRFLCIHFQTKITIAKCTKVWITFWRGKFEDHDLVSYESEYEICLDHLIIWFMSTNSTTDKALNHDIILITVHAHDLKKGEINMINFLEEVHQDFVIIMLIRVLDQIQFYLRICDVSHR